MGVRGAAGGPNVADGRRARGAPRPDAKENDVSETPDRPLSDEDMKTQGATVPRAERDADATDADADTTDADATDATDGRDSDATDADADSTDADADSTDADADSTDSRG
jgi:hypothetical protein